MRKDLHSIFRAFLSRTESSSSLRATDADSAFLNPMFTTSLASFSEDETKIMQVGALKSCKSIQLQVIQKFGPKGVAEFVDDTINSVKIVKSQEFSYKSHLFREARLGSGRGSSVRWCAASESAPACRFAPCTICPARRICNIVCTMTNDTK